MQEPVVVSSDELEKLRRLPHCQRVPRPSPGPEPHYSHRQTAYSNRTVNIEGSKQESECLHSAFFQCFIFRLDKEEVYKDNFKNQPRDVEELCIRV
jgi:hypothetical protein